MSDLGGSLREIASFLNIAIDESNFDNLVNLLTFASVKSADNIICPLDGTIFHGGKATFINKGTNGRWKGVLSYDQLEQYDTVVAAKLSLECAAWLNGGKSAFNPKA